MGVLFVLLLKKEESILVTRGDEGAFLAVLLRNTTNEKIDEHRDQIYGKDSAAEDEGEPQPLFDPLFARLACKAAPDAFDVAVKAPLGSFLSPKEIIKRNVKAP